MRRFLGFGRVGKGRWIAMCGGVVLPAVLGCSMMLTVPESHAETQPKPAAASTKGPTLVGAPMKVSIVRGGTVGCEPNSREWIAADGRIDHDTLPQFKKVLKALGSRKLPVLIHSGGGTVDEALEIGRLIRAKGLDVAVAKTVTVRRCLPAAAEPKIASDQTCRPDPARPDTVVPRAVSSYCASSCAFILAAGTHRYASMRTPVGVHQIVSFKTTAQILQKFRILTRREWGVPVEVERKLISEKRVNEKTFQTETPESTYKKLSKYFTEMGVTDAVMPMIKSTPNTSMHWMSSAERVATHLVTDPIDGEQMITGVAKLTAPPVVPLTSASPSLDAFKQIAPVAATPDCKQPNVQGGTCMRPVERAIPAQ